MADRPPERPADLWVAGQGAAGSAEPMGAPLLPQPPSSLPGASGAAHWALPLLCPANRTVWERTRAICEDALRYDFNNSGVVGK